MFHAIPAETVLRQLAEQTERDLRYPLPRRGLRTVAALRRTRRQAR